MRPSGKVNAYVRAHQKHQRLARAYQAKLDALLPLKRKRDAAELDVKIRRAKMTGGELASAQRLISAAPLAFEHAAQA